MSADTEWQAQATRQAALSMGEWLMEAGVLEKKVRQLSMTDMQAMAATVIARWIVLRSEKEQEPKPPPPPILYGM